MSDHRLSTGPLLWHWEGNTSNDPSIELTLDEVKALARKIGFEISVSPSKWPPTPPISPFSRLDLHTCVAQNERTIDTTYTNNAQSMLGYVYHAAFWTATKII